MLNKNPWIWVSAALLCTLVVSLYLSIYYYQENLKYQQLYAEALKELEKYENYIAVNILIDYGNGTMTWHNNTLVPFGSNFFTATITIAELNYTKGKYGIFVTAINGVGGDPNHFWIWYIWNSTTKSWDWGPVACDAYILHNGDILSWVYTKF